MGSYSPARPTNAHPGEGSIVQLGRISKDLGIIKVYEKAAAAGFVLEKWLDKGSVSTKKETDSGAFFVDLVRLDFGRTPHS